MVRNRAWGCSLTEARQWHCQAHNICQSYPTAPCGVLELEGLGVVWAVKHFRHYIYGTVYTHHEALKSFLNTSHPSGKLARWGMELDLAIEYRPGKGNTRADALLQHSVSEDDTIDIQVHPAMQAKLKGGKRYRDHPMSIENSYVSGNKTPSCWTS